VPWQNPTGFVLTYPSVLAHAPAAPGVYGVYSGSRWLYFGESDDLRRTLLDVLADRSHCLHQFPTLHFSVEPSPNRVDRLHALLLTYKTPCNSLFE
jgi:hypothetical protein